MSYDARLQELGIQLPDPPPPGGTYSPALQTGNLLYISGHGPVQLDGKLIQGQVGSDLTLEQGKEAARIVGLGILATIRNHLGSLDRVQRFVKTLGMVYATPDFTKHPLVINGFSDLIVEIFGEQGRAARSAVGMGSLPNNIPVEIEVILEVE